MRNRISSHRGNRTVLVAASFLAFLFAPLTWAQFNAQLAGTVTDTSGVVIGGATITLTNNGTQVIQKTTSSGSGFYSFNELPPRQLLPVRRKTSIGAQSIAEIDSTNSAARSTSYSPGVAPKD
ncbi:MAG: carboxypeptidase-like regulatory domain-containing protein [Silvibacterium sp.]